MTALFALGAALPLAMFQEWARWIPRPLLVMAARAAALVLLLRGGAGWLDTALRETDAVPNGLTGLTYEQVTGSADPSSATVCAGVAIDAIFVAGGLLFALAQRAMKTHRGR